MTKKKNRKIKKNNMKKKKKKQEEKEKEEKKKRKCSKLSDNAHCKSEWIFTAEYCWSKHITQPASQPAYCGWHLSIYLLYSLLSPRYHHYHSTSHFITSLTSNCLWDGHDMTCYAMLCCLTQHTHFESILYSIVQYDDISCTYCCTYDLLLK